MLRRCGDGLPAVDSGSVRVVGIIHRQRVLMLEGGLAGPGVESVCQIKGGLFTDF